MRLDNAARALVGTVMALPPTRLARFLLSTTRTGVYGTAVCEAHARQQRVKDANTMKVLADMALWASKTGTPAFAEETQNLLRAFTRQTEVELSAVLDPHAASVTKALLDRSAS